MLFGNSGQINPVNENVEVSPEVEALILEGALLDLGSNELVSCLEDANDLAIATRENIALERTIVRLDKKARFSQAQKIAAFTLAKEANDPKMKKLMTVWAWERHLEAFLMRKYGPKATRRAREVVRKQGNTRSKMIKKAATKVKSELDGEIKQSGKNLKAPTEKITGNFKSLR